MELIIIGVVLHLLMAMMLAPKFAIRQAALCNNCSKGKAYKSRGFDGSLRTHEPLDGHTGVLPALVWPLTGVYALSTRKDPRVVQGKQAIKHYWDEKERLRQEAIIKSLENEAFK